MKLIAFGCLALSYWDFRSYAIWSKKDSMRSALVFFAFAIFFTIIAWSLK